MTDKGNYRSKAKPVDNNMYYMVQFDGKRMGDPLVVYPIKSWYEFESEIQHKTLTTKEAENIINSRKKSDEGYGQWMEKVSRDGLEGKQSSIFYEFPRVLNEVKQIMRSIGMMA